MTLGSAITVPLDLGPGLTVLTIESRRLSSLERLPLAITDFSVGPGSR